MNIAQWNALFVGPPPIPGTLENYIALSEANARLDPPDGGDFGGLGIVVGPEPGVRRAYRNYCVWLEIAGGVYTIADAPNTARFR